MVEIGGLVVMRGCTLKENATKLHMRHPIKCRTPPVNMLMEAGKHSSTHGSLNSRRKRVERENSAIMV